LTRLLLNLFAVYATVFQYTSKSSQSQSWQEMKAVRSATRERQNNARQADQISRRIDLHKEWCNEIFI
jgi:bacterioferritin (cytochrome b1)